MDTKIRSLLSVAQKNLGTHGFAHLQEAYGLLRTVAATRPAVDAPESFGQDLYVLCAETAFQHGNPDMARECLQMYFMKTPPTNQFLCRAYLCQSQLLAPTSADNPEQLEKAVVYLVKAINMAKENPRYHFLVYNASVLYWQFCRPFLKPYYRQYLARSLHQVVKALDDIDDKDYEWRAQLMIALIECHMDAGRKNDASHIATAAAGFIKQHVPALYKTVFGLMVRHQLVDPTKFSKDLRTSPELSVYYKICRLKLAIETKDPERDVLEEMKKILIQTTGQDDTKSTGTTTSRDTGTRGRRSTTPTGGDDRPYLLLELGRLALEQNYPDITQQCVDIIRDLPVKEQSFFLEVEFLQAELMVKRLGDNQESYHRTAVDIRLQSIKRCDEAILNAIRLANPNVIQAGCVTQWNLCLPLLQPNLRHHIRRPLTTIAQALEDINSLLIQLRCQVHTELAKCEEDQEQIQVAMDHLQKALALDDGNVYQERLQVALHRLQLRAELYEQPEAPEDQAAMIIEQARKADSGTMRMKRSLLVRAGQALAPDAFLLVLESENDAKEVSSGKGPLTQIKKLAGKAYQFNKCVRKAVGHLKRLGDENDRERARLWGDLAKTARKQEVWDVCRVAARFCLLYDDNRWKNEPAIKDSTIRLDRSRTNTHLDTDKSSTDLTVSRTSLKDKDKDKDSSRPVSPERGVPLYDKDLIRMMAEVNFINGEALIHLLRSEGIQMGDAPIPPEDKSKHPKGYVPKKPEDDPDWIEYCEWIKLLSNDAETAFLRAVALGIELHEPWIVCSAAAYVWNYNNHILTDNRHREIVDTFQTVLDGLKRVGHAGETILLVNICNALATGLIHPWEPVPPPREMVMPNPPPPPKTDGSKSPTRGRSASKSRSAAAPPAGKAKTVPSNVTINADGMPDIKRAMEVCEYALQVTNGQNPGDVVPIAFRLPLLQTWLKTKQMQQLQLSKGLGTADESNTDGQNPMTRAMVATELLSLNNNGIMEFRDAPTLPEVIEMVEGCQWPDKLVELQLWTTLTYLAFQAKEHQSVVKCANMALQFEVGTQPKGKKVDQHKYVVEQELLSYAACLLGQSLIENTQGKNSVRRQSLEQFLYSAKYGLNAQNFELVITAARHYWNACLPLVNQPIERELLKEPLRTLLHCISTTTDKKKYMKKDDEDELDEALAPPGPAASGIPPVAAVAEGGEVVPAGDSQEKAPGGTGIIGGPDDDLTLRAYLYGVLFQAYADKGEWEAGLRAMDQAINDMPRTNHRLLIFKHLVIVRAKLGKNVTGSIQKFKDESEDYVAHMWRRVALCAQDTLDQLTAYQNAIEALNSPSNEWQKFDYLLEFGQWLFCNEFPLQDCLDQMEWAADILLNMKFEVEKKKDSKGGKKGKKKSKSPPPGKTGKGGKGDKKGADKGKEEEPKTPQLGDISELDVDAADYVPVAKEAVIDSQKGIEGVLPNNPNLTVQELTDIRQLEGLFRVHTTMGELSGRGTKDFADYTLVAYGFIMRIWQVSLNNAGPVIKELAKNPPAETASKGSAKNKGKKDKEPVKEKPKRKGALEHMPNSTEEWAGYDVPDEVLEAFKQDTMKTSGINSHTILKPMLTLHYVMSLVQQLRDCGYHHLTLPVLALAELLSRQLVVSRPLNALIHFKAMEVCVELNLMTAAGFHQKLADFKLNEDDQAKSREEMALWQEQKAQVAKEELRLRASINKFKKITDQTDKPQSKQDKEMQQKLEQQEVTSTHLGKKLSGIQLREIWTNMAEIMLKQGLYQPARELLNEALQAAQAFGDMSLVACILFLLAKLSYTEAQYGQAVSLCQQAQQAYDGDEMFWYNTTMLMIDAMLADYNLKTRNKKARGILVHALNVFVEVAELRQNKTSITGYVLAKLEAKLGSIQAIVTFTEHDNILKPKVTEALEAACNKLQNGADQLIHLGYRREAVEILQEKADILTKLARAHINPAEKHSYYVQALTVLQKAVKVTDHVYQDVQTLAPLQEMRNISLPVQRESAVAKLSCVQLTLEMLEVYVREERENQLQEERKGAVLKLVEDFIKETPNYTASEKQWVETTKILGESILVEAAAAHSLTKGIHDLRAKSLYSLGRCLRLLSLYKGPDAPSLWDNQQLNMLPVARQLSAAPPPSSEKSKEKVASEKGLETDDETHVQEDDGKEEEEEEEMDTSSRQYIINSQIITKMKAALGASHHNLLQATECLAQAVNLSLQHGHTSIAGAAALELVECIGQFDPNLASQYLALHQSCVASEYMENLLHMALVDPTVSQQAALLHQRSCLLKGDVKTNASRGPTMQAVQATLKEVSLAWQNLAISPQHLDLLKELPPNFTVVILQHSPDKSKLYGALLDKPKPSGGGGKQKHAALQAGTKAKVVCMDTSAARLEDLLSRFKWYKHDVMTFLLKLEYQRSQQAQREKMLANLDQSLRGSGQQEGGLKLGRLLRKVQLDEDIVKEEEKLEEEFWELVQAVEQYLQPITSLLETSLRPSSATTVSNSKDKSKELSEPQEYVVLLADPWLMEMPLESLATLQAETIVSLSREISLQLLYHKNHIEPLDEAAEKAKREKERTKPPSRIPGLRDAAKKLAKIIPLERQVPPTCLPIDTHSFRFVVDPHLDCSETEQHAPIPLFNEMLELHSQQFTPRWLGVPGDDHVPSAGEYEIYCLESSAVIFYGMERFLDYLPPHKVAALNLPDCELMMLYDLAQTSKSFLRQAKIDVLKSPETIALEKPVNAALLLGLTGVKCVIQNQWHCTLQENAEKLDSTMKDLLPGGKSTGEMVRYLFTPYRRKEDVEEGEEGQEEEAGQEPEVKDKDKGSELASQDGTESQIYEAEAEELVKQKKWFNMVCYGLPNLIVTQLSKN